MDNGLGDRVSQTVNGITTNFVLDLNAGLTQVLQDDTYTYQYGGGRIAQHTATTAEYFLTDALGSERQMTDASGAVVSSQSYQPFGEELSSQGTAESRYGYTGEQSASTNLLYVRARYYSSGQGRFLSTDPWEGNYELPGTLNSYLYGLDNPVIFTDPSGKWCVVGFSVGPGRVCNPDEVQRWAGYYADEAQIWYQIGSSSHQALGFVYGFAHEYLDAISVIGVSSIVHIVLGELVGCGATQSLLNPDVVAGRYAGRWFAAGQGAAEFGYGLAGIIGGGGISLTGGGAIAGVPVAAFSAVLAGHGALVVSHVITKELVDPLPNIFFSSSSGGSTTPPGKWGPRRGSGGADYEELVRQHNGNPADKNLYFGPDNMAYDGWNPNSNSFVDAKYSKGNWFTDNLRGKISVIREKEIIGVALKEVKNSPPYGVEWWTNSAEAQIYLSDLFGNYGIPIKVIKWP